jgi:hypothetical protein
MSQSRGISRSVSWLRPGLGLNGLERHDGDWLQDDCVGFEVDLEERVAPESQSAPHIRR